MRRPILLLLLLACACRHAPPERMSAEEAVLDRQRRGLLELVKAGQEKRLAPAGGILVVVDESLVQKAIAVAIPYERTVADRFLVRITAASVDFDDGFALVKLDGRASLAGRPESEAAADVSVYGALDVVEIDPRSSTLQGRVTLLAVDARQVDVLGVRSRQAEELVEELGREQLQSFAELASGLEIPVQVQSAVDLPAVSAGGVTIAAATLPMRARVADLKAFRGRLWIGIEAAVGTAP